MSITGALYNAISGLNATQRNAAVTSSNIANATTEGYVRRELSLVSNSEGNMGGVRVNGVIRQSDPAVLAERRLSDARFGYRDTIASGAAEVERVLGRPDEGHSVSARVAKLESSLVSASSLPSSQARLQTVLDDAKALVTSLSEKSFAIQDVRESAEREIDKSVNELNRSLEQLQRVNARIVSGTVQRVDTAGMEDERQRIIDRISELVPVRVMQRDFNSVSLITTKGAMLFDISSPEITFDASTVITAHQKIENDTLSTIQLNGKAIDMSDDGAALSGGRLQALFELRDSIAPEAQSRLDAFSLDLIERFETSVEDPTRTITEPALFTDAGNISDTSNVTGLSTRLAINAAVDPTQETGPSQPGQLWRLRDGLGANSEGEASDATLLSSYRHGIIASQSGSDPALLNAQRSLSGHAAFIETSSGTRSENARLELAITAAEHNELKMMESRSGVDTDQELQNLLLIEQAYAANARVIQTAQSMLDSLMRI